MRRVPLFSSRKLLKRVRQVAYLGSHPISHGRCMAAIRDSRLVADPLTSFKYLGDHLALSLKLEERRQALIDHYSLLPQLLEPAAAAQLTSGVEIWRRELQDELPLRIVLEYSSLAPMEGELQLRFAFRTELCVLTFLIAGGELFGSDGEIALFIGGVQGRIGAREEMREAARANEEIAPTTMLMLAVQSLAKAAGIRLIIGVAEEDHISTSYSPEKIVFDYPRFWSEAGGERVGDFYRIPVDTPHKPLSEIQLSHRRRTKRKREAKQHLKLAMERRWSKLVQPRSDTSALAAE